MQPKRRACPRLGRLVLDGVFHREPGAERPSFRAARRLSEADLSDVQQAVRAKIHGLLRRRGLLPDESSEDRWDEKASPPRGVLLSACA